MTAPTNNFGCRSVPSIVCIVMVLLLLLTIKVFQFGEKSKGALVLTSRAPILSSHHFGLGVVFRL